MHTLAGRRWLSNCSPPVDLLALMCDSAAIFPTSELFDIPHSEIRILVVSIRGFWAISSVADTLVRPENVLGSSLKIVPPDGVIKILGESSESVMWGVEIPHVTLPAIVPCTTAAD